MTYRLPDQKMPFGRARSRGMPFAVLGVAALALSACQSVHSATGTFDPNATSYEQRHPLTLQQQEHSLPILVGSGASSLTAGDRTALSGFIQTYMARGEGSLRIRVPQGSQNAQAATAVLGDIHDVVAIGGINPGHVRVEHYQVGNPHAHAPVLVIYDRLEAVTNPCGDWADPINPALEQTDYYNYGCASQANFAAMLQDPRDLVRPRGLGYPDAGRRAQVLSAYRAGQSTSTQTSPDSQASVAEVN